MTSAPEMKELEVTIRVRNNRLKQRRDELGWTQRQMSRAVECGVHAYGALENMRAKPRMANGEWRAVSRKLAAFHAVPIEELFPEAVERIDNPVAVRCLDGAEMALLSESQYTDALPPDVAYGNKEWGRVLRRALKTLTPREESVLRRRFGLDCDTHTLAEVGHADGRSVERTRQVEWGALQELRRALRE